MSALAPLAIQAGSTISQQMYQYLEDLGDFPGMAKKTAQYFNLASRILCSLSLLGLSQEMKVLQPLASRTWLLLTPIISKTLEIAIDNESFRSEDSSRLKKNIYTTIKTVSKYSTQILTTATHVTLVANSLLLGSWYAAALSITPLLSLSMVFSLPPELITSEESTNSEENNFELFKEEYSEKRLLDADVLGFLNSLQNEGVEESEIMACIDMATQNLRNEQSKEVLQLKEEGEAIYAALEKEENDVLPRLIDYLQTVQRAFYLYEKERVKTLLSGESALSDFVDSSPALQDYLQFVEENKASLANCVNCFLNSLIANDCVNTASLLKSTHVNSFFNDDDSITLTTEADLNISLLDRPNLNIYSFLALRQSFESLNTDYEKYNDALLKIEEQIQKRKIEFGLKIRDQFIARLDRLLDQKCEALKSIQEQHSPGVYSLQIKSKTYEWNQASDSNGEFLKFISDTYQTLSQEIGGRYLSYNMSHFLPNSWFTQSEIQAQSSLLPGFMAEKNSDLSFLIQLYGLALFSPNIMEIWQNINDQEGDLNSKISKYLELKKFISDSDLFISSSIFENISDTNEDLRGLRGYAIKKGIVKEGDSSDSFLASIRKLKSKKDEILAKIDTLTAEVDEALKEAPDDEALLN